VPFKQITDIERWFVVVHGIRYKREANFGGLRTKNIPVIGWSKMSIFETRTITMGSNTSSRSSPGFIENVMCLESLKYSHSPRGGGSRGMNIVAGPISVLFKQLFVLFMGWGVELVADQLTFPRRDA
jgi:hypothetical protein